MALGVGAEARAVPVPASGSRPAGLWLLGVAALGALGLPLLVESPYLLHIAVVTGFYVILVQSLNLVLGYCGLLSFASPAFFGVGAYVAAVLGVASQPVVP